MSAAHATISLQPITDFVKFVCNRYIISVCLNSYFHNLHKCVFREIVRNTFQIIPTNRDFYTKKSLMHIFIHLKF